MRVDDLARVDELKFIEQIERLYDEIHRGGYKDVTGKLLIDHPTFKLVIGMTQGKESAKDAAELLAEHHRWLRYGNLTDYYRIIDSVKELLKRSNDWIHPRGKGLPGNSYEHLPTGVLFWIDENKLFIKRGDGCLDSYFRNDINSRVVNISTFRDNDLEDMQAQFNIIKSKLDESEKGYLMRIMESYLGASK